MKADENQPKKKGLRRLQPMKINAIDPATLKLAPYLLLALAAFALFPQGNLGQAKDDFSRLIGVILLCIALGVLAYQRWGRPNSN